MRIYFIRDGAFEIQIIALLVDCTPHNDDDDDDGS